MIVVRITAIVVNPYDSPAYQLLLADGRMRAVSVVRCELAERAYDKRGGFSR